MLSKEKLLEIVRAAGLSAATDLSLKAATLDGTALIEREMDAPDFTEAVKKKNMLQRSVGFVCCYDGQVWKLLQVYDSDTYTDTPDRMRTQWALCHTKDPAKAKPFVPSQGTSGMYMKDECCKVDTTVYRSKVDDNVWEPTNYPAGWEVVN